MSNNDLDTIVAELHASQPELLTILQRITTDPTPEFLTAVQRATTPKPYRSIHRGPDDPLTSEEYKEWYSAGKSEMTWRDVAETGAFFGGLIAISAFLGWMGINLQM